MPKVEVEQLTAAAKEFQYCRVRLATPGSLAGLQFSVLLILMLAIDARSDDDGAAGELDISG